MVDEATLEGLRRIEGAHNFKDCTPAGPPYERALKETGELISTAEMATGEIFQLWRTQIYVCTKCWEVRLHSRSPESVDAKLKKAMLSILIVNPGDGSCEEEDK